MDALQRLAGCLVPARCCACSAPAADRGQPLCGRCARSLAALRPTYPDLPAGVDLLWSSAPHDGVARDLVAALKFRRLLVVARLMAERIADHSPLGLLGPALVPVPAAPGRHRARGFDPAGEIAARLARDLGTDPNACLSRRTDRRQVGRGREERLRAPPSIRVVRPVPDSVVLVDDVTTTGATLAACAAALRAGGARSVMAVTFTARA